MADLHARDELVKQIRNRCDIYGVLRRQPLPEQLEHLIPTLLEDMAEDVQELLDTYCVVDK